MYISWCFYIGTVSRVWTGYFLFFDFCWRCIRRRIGVKPPTPRPLWIRIYGENSNWTIDFGEVWKSLFDWAIAWPVKKSTLAFSEGKLVITTISEISAARRARIRLLIAPVIRALAAKRGVGGEGKDPSTIPLILSGAGGGKSKFYEVRLPLLSWPVPKGIRDRMTRQVRTSTHICTVQPGRNEKHTSRWKEKKKHDPIIRKLTRSFGYV